MSLLSLVAEYASREHHRSGTDNDRLTCDWLCAELDRRGLDSTVYPYRFSRYQADWQCLVDGHEVVSIPLFFSAFGEFSLNGCTLRRIRPDHWDEQKTLDEISDIVAAERADGAQAVVVATDTPAGEVCALNVANHSSFDFAVMLIGSRDYRSDASVNGHLHARRENATARCIVAEPADGRSPQLILTTPYSGWFSCAAERGAGIAVVLELVARLGARIPLQVVATSGHEHHHLGSDAIQAMRDFDPETTLLHIGSCVGAPAASCQVTSNFDTTILTRHFAGQQYQIVSRELHEPAAHWPGESANWVNGRRPILSLSGTDDVFHTPADRVEHLDENSLLQVTDALEQTILAIFSD